MNEITVRITTPLRKFVGGRHEVQVRARTAGDALLQLNQQYPDLEGRLTTADGELREFIQVHIGKTPLGQFGGLQAPLAAGTVMSVSSPFSGG
jgi:sulfur-carrier protein